MYRFLLLLFTIIAATVALYLRLPWYTIGIATCVLTALFPVWRRGGFYFPFLAGLLVWGVYTGYIHFITEGRLTDRLAVTFGVGNGWALVFFTALIGGMTAGLGGWLGASVRRLIVSRKSGSGVAG